MARERSRHSTISQFGPPQVGAKPFILPGPMPGFKVFTDRHGKPRCYHRQSGTAVDLRRYPPDLPEFVAECNRIIEQFQKKRRLQGCERRLAVRSS